MIKKQMELQIATKRNAQGTRMDFFPEERIYAEKHQLLTSENVVNEIDTSLRFSEAIIERCNKETEELISKELPTFLGQTLVYLKTNRNEFLYVEFASLTTIGVDAIALEFDEVFETYTAMLGLKLQKKYGNSIKTYLNNHLIGERATYSVLFSEEDGLWHVNIPLDHINNFKENMSLEDAFEHIYRFLFILVENIEEQQ